jgi:hypothetical protein
VGARGLPARLRRAGAVSDRPRRARRSRLDAPDGRHAPLQPRARQERRIDAIAVARAALAAGIDTLPTAALAGPELDLRLLVDHRERLVRTRVALNSTLQ